MKKYKSSTCLLLWKMRNGKLAIAGDRRCTTDLNYMTMEYKKINKYNNILLAATGDCDLCNVLIQQAGFKIPECRTKNIASYMFNIFKPALHEFLKYYYHIDKGHPLTLPTGKEVGVLIGIGQEGWECNIENRNPSDSTNLMTEISLMRVPVLPATAGCGSIEAFCLSKYILEKQGYLSKNDVRDIYKIVGNMNNGCDSNCDIITQD